ncbi:MAG TPA: alpha/beta hydrolase [Sporosarcina sp.]|nr:alpha/beta hydrolase [Sporosarcina sp.]
MTKEILLFLHGGGVDDWMWSQQLPAFSDYECITPTLQGHGVRSDEQSFSIRQNALEIIAFIEQRCQHRIVHVIGFSVGAQIALEIIHLRPKMFQTAMINSALVIPQKRLYKWAPLLAKWTAPLMRSKTFNQLQAKQLGIPQALFPHYIETSLSINSNMLAALLQENLQFSLPPHLDETSTKVLVTVGGKERRIMKQSARLIVQANHTFQLIECLQIGHHFPLSHPQAFNQLLRTWIEQHT